MNLGCRSETCCMWVTDYTGRKKSPKICHLHTITHICQTIFTTKARIDNQKKKLVKQQYLPQMSWYHELRPTSGWDRFGSLGTPANFNGLRVLAALLHGTVVVGVSQTLRRWIEGVAYIRQGGHYIRLWPAFRMCVYFVLSVFLS